MKYLVYDKSTGELVCEDSDIMFATKKAAEKAVDDAMADGWDDISNFEVFCVTQVYTLSEPSDVKYNWATKDV